MDDFSHVSNGNVFVVFEFFLLGSRRFSGVHVLFLYPGIPIYGFYRNNHCLPNTFTSKTSSFDGQLEAWDVEYNA